MRITYSFLCFPHFRVRCSLFSFTKCFQLFSFHLLVDGKIWKSSASAQHCIHTSEMSWMKFTYRTPRTRRRLDEHRTSSQRRWLDMSHMREIVVRSRQLLITWKCNTAQLQPHRSTDKRNRLVARQLQCGRNFIVTRQMRCAAETL